MLTASRAGPAAMPTASNRAAWRGPEEGMGGGGGGAGGVSPRGDRGGRGGPGGGGGGGGGRQVGGNRAKGA